ncbi:hypothetical protein PAXINDRAFT_169916 [Paxillus involutus ATCC 200175]|uniref:Uncharacterized protein n=1 Tax=Paxillus involutus ATCC 200175 TaxID=664439 RepID=A0A0C9TVK3_PAXIN|nr:hypothetical protein PAXINDRAFT_169916 [Paxillus involutus ATCC 200175]
MYSSPDGRLTASLHEISSNAKEWKSRGLNGNPENDGISVETHGASSLSPDVLPDANFTSVHS